MPVFESQRLGDLTYDSESAIEFPRGLPGFDDRRAFVAVHLPGADPLVFLQSLEDPALCFITAPVAINLRNRKAVQAVSVAPGYSHQHALDAEGYPVCS